MDCFTKWLEVYPIPDQTAETCAAKLLDEYIGRFGGIPNEDPNHFVLLSSRPLSSVIKYGNYVRYLHFPLDFLRWSQSKVTNRKPKAPLGSIPVGGPLDCVTTDIVGPFDTSISLWISYAGP
jgi:hypothetical protein